MSVKVDRLVKRITELKISGDDIAGILGINPSTYYRKISNGGRTFTVEQAQRLVDALGLSKDEAIDIFFAEQLAETRELAQKEK